MEKVEEKEKMQNKEESKNEKEVDEKVKILTKYILKRRGSRTFKKEKKTKKYR